MGVSYKKLWKLLIDKDMMKKELEERAGISHYTMNKLNKGENVTMEMLGRICKVLNCKVDDIMEFIDDQEFENHSISKPIISNHSLHEDSSFSQQKEM